jgi:uncharacterized protein YjgD (DUF1641 family)/fumarate reductase subunit D
MADKEYLIEVVLQAKDDMARAFAQATGELEAYDALLREQKTKVDAAKAAQAGYRQEIERGQTSLQRLRKAEVDAGVANAEHAKALQRVEEAQRAVVRAEQSTDPKARVIALQAAVKANKDLAEVLQRETNVTKRQSEIEANRYERLAAGSARAEQAIQQEAKQIQERDRVAAAAYAKEEQRAKAAATARLQRARSDIQIYKQEQQSQIQAAQDADRKAKQIADAQVARAKQNIRVYEDQQRILSGARAPAEALARPGSSAEQEFQATKKLSAAKDELIAKGLSEADAEKRIHEVRQQALHDYGFADQATRNASVSEAAHTEALKMAEAELQKVERYERAVANARKVGGDVTRITRPAAQSFALADVARGQGAGGGDATQGVSSVTSALGSLQGALQRADTTTSGFDQHLRSAFGFGTVALIEPITVLIVGLVGAFGALASAAVSAATAIGATFVTAIAQGVPALGLFAIAMQRVQSVMGYVQALLQRQQAAWIAQFETQKQTALGINQVVIAIHEYSDALFAQQSAVINVGIAQHQYQDSLVGLKNAQFAEKAAELGLLQTRLQATRQLQDLIFQEVQARLAAEASTLAITHSQVALVEATATGGDVASAQLNLAQATAQHQQATVQQARAAQDAARGSITRREIALQTQEAANAVRQSRVTVRDAQFAVAAAARGIIEAQRAVVDARFQVAQARAAIVEAQMAARGYNLGTEAQLAYLRATMSKTEFALTRNILNILGLFRTIPGHVAAFRTITDAILRPFVDLTGRILKVLTDPRIFNALTELAQAMSRGMGTIIDTIFNPKSISVFVGIIKDAAANIGPVAKIIADLFKIIQAVVVATGPALGSFLKFIEQIAGNIAKWATSMQGRNWLKGFIDEGFNSLKAFLNLGMAIIRLVAAIVGAGGGAKAGMGLIQSFTKTLNNLTDDINNKHSKAFKDLQILWKTAPIALHALAEILGAVGKGLLQIAGTKQGQDALKNLADFASKVLVPAFIKFVEETGKIIGSILQFLAQHPKLRAALVDVIGYGLAIAVATKAVRLFFGPLAGIIGLVTKLGKGFKYIKDLEMAKMFSNIASAGGGFAKGFGGIIRGRLPGATATGAGAAENAGTAAAGLGTAAVGSEVGVGAGVGEGAAGAAGVAGAATGIGAAVIAILALIKWTGTLSKLWAAIKAPFIAIWNAIQKPLADLGKQFSYFISAFTNASGPIGVFKSILTTAFTFIFGLAKTVFGGIGKAIGDFFGGIIKIISGIFEIIGGILHGNLGKVVDGAKKIGLGLLQGIFGPIKDLGQLIANLITGAIKGIAKLGGLALHAGIGLIKSLVKGITQLPSTLLNFGTWLWGQIESVVSNLPGDFEQLGKDLIQAIVNGIKDAPSIILDAIKSLIPAPLQKLISGATGIVGSALSAVGLQRGGPVSGSGSGDIQPAMLEPGEHIITKSEVQAAGGHGGIFAIRRALGGGDQGGPIGYQDGGVPGSSFLTPTQRGGIFQVPYGTEIGSVSILTKSIMTANAALNRLAARISSRSINISKSLTAIESSYELIAATFDNMTTAITNAAAIGTASAQLMANGFRLVGQKLVQVGAVPILQQAQAFVKANDANIAQLQALQGSENEAYQGVVKQIQALGKPRTKAQKELYTRLVGQRQDFLNKLQTTDQSLVDAMQNQYTDAINVLDTAAQRQMTALDIRDRLAPVIAGLGGPGGQQRAAALQVSTSQARTSALQGQISGYQNLLQDATAKGNTEAMHTLQDKIADLTTQEAESMLATQQLITSQQQLAATMIQTRASVTQGTQQGASGILQTLGEITGSMNLPQQIALARSSIADLKTQAQGIAQTVKGAAGGTGFGAFQGQAAPILQQLMGAFQQGPMQYAQTLGQLGPQIGALEAMMPQDIATLFQNLIDSMTGNTQATADNTLTLRQYQATTLTQQFASSAWSMFRSAIFSGIGTLLPQFAMSVPGAQIGGHIKSSGLLYGHAGEHIVPAKITSPYSVGPTTQNTHVHVTNPTQVADPVHLGNAIAFRLNHDPNAR